MGRTRSDPVIAAAEVIWDEWSFLLLRAAFLRARRFDDFIQAAPISRNRLAQRLTSLVEHGLFEKHIDGHFPIYRLTERAFALYPVIVMLLRWAQQAQGMARPTLELLHEGSHPLVPQVECRFCHGVISASDVRYQVDNDQSATPLAEPAQRRRRFRHSTDDSNQARIGIDAELSFALDAIGDRWSVLVLRSVFIGNTRFDAIQADLGIARNILSDRLARLEQHTLLTREIYSTRPPRSEYRLAPRALSLYPVIVALMAWSTQWLPQPASTIHLWHKPCGKRLQVNIRCAGCSGQIDARTVSVEHTSGVAVAAV